MYKRILVALDGSDTSGLALQEAIALAKDGSSILRLVHVVDLTTIYASLQEPYVADYQGALLAEGQRVIAEASARVKAAGIQCDAKCVSTPAKAIYDLLEEEVKEWSADLIVIGTHGRRGVRRLFLGSVAEGFIRVASKPVLLIRKE